MKSQRAGSKSESRECLPFSFPPSKTDPLEWHSSMLLWKYRGGSSVYTCTTASLYRSSRFCWDTINLQFYYEFKKILCKPKINFQASPHKHCFQKMSSLKQLVKSPFGSWVMKCGSNSYPLNQLAGSKNYFWRL